MTQALWTQKGESLSHNNACKEYGLEEKEIIDAIETEKLQYKINYVHGNPYYKLLRKEVIALVIELRGKNYFKRQEIEFKIKTLNKEINSCKRKIKANEREKESLNKQLDQLENE
jgi:septal ring factor EnvC (AmiA/AmiB activator)